MSALDEALPAHADGDLCAEAAAALLIAGRWPDRGDFAGRNLYHRHFDLPTFRSPLVTCGNTDFYHPPHNLSDTLCPGGERRLLQVTFSLAAGIPVDLRDTAAGLDGRNARLAADAMLHASGHQDMR